MLKPPCPRRGPHLAVVAVIAVFIVRGILIEGLLLLLGRAWSQKSWCPVAVATNRSQWEWVLRLGVDLGLGLGLGGDLGFGLGLDLGSGFGWGGLGDGLLGGRVLLGTAFAPKALASGKLWQQCAGLHGIAASTAPLAFAARSGPLRLGHLPVEQPKVDALVALILGSLLLAQSLFRFDLVRSGDAEWSIGSVTGRNPFVLTRAEPSRDSSLSAST